MLLWLWTLTYFCKTERLPPQTYRMPCGTLPDFVSILVYDSLKFVTLKLAGASRKLVILQQHSQNAGKTNMHFQSDKKIYKYPMDFHGRNGQMLSCVMIFSCLHFALKNECIYQFCIAGTDGTVVGNVAEHLHLVNKRKSLLSLQYSTGNTGFWPAFKQCVYMYFSHIMTWRQNISNF